VQVLSLTGGTLAAGRIDATNLRGSVGGTNGGVVNNGTNIAPGDLGFSGATAIVGDLTIASGTMSFDLGGTTASTAFQDVGLGKYDQVTITGTTVTLGGDLDVKFIAGFTPVVSNSFTLINASGAASISTTFINAASTYTVTDGGLNYIFGVNYAGGTGNDVVLTLNNITPIPEPSAYAALAGFGAIGLALYRRRRSLKRAA
jgi:hypothetical protein